MVRSKPIMERLEQAVDLGLDASDDFNGVIRNATGFLEETTSETSDEEILNAVVQELSERMTPDDQ